MSRFASRLDVMLPSQWALAEGLVLYAPDGSELRIEGMSGRRFTTLDALSDHQVATLRDALAGFAVDSAEKVMIFDGRPGLVRRASYTATDGRVDLLLACALDAGWAYVAVARVTSSKAVDSAIDVLRRSSLRTQIAGDVAVRFTLEELLGVAAVCGTADYAGAPQSALAALPDDARHAAVWAATRSLAARGVVDLDGTTAMLKKESAWLEPGARNDLVVHVVADARPTVFAVRDREGVSVVPVGAVDGAMFDVAAIDAGALPSIVTDAITSAGSGCSLRTLWREAAVVTGDEVAIAPSASHDDVLQAVLGVLPGSYEGAHP